MKAFLALFFLGVLQGLTEFLPVSSSGHLVLFSNLFGIEESLFVSIILHLATFFSVLVVLRKEIWQMVKHPFSEQTMSVVVATIPTCVIVLLLMPLVKQSFSGVFLPLSFAISAVLLFIAQVFSKKTKNKPFNFKTALLMGVAQGFAVFPGISRSGTTISAGLIGGSDKEQVAKFSFIMSLPIILLSLAMEIFEMCSGKLVLNVNVLALIFSFLIAFLVGIFAIKFMIRLTSKANFRWFSAYLILISILSIFLM